MSMYPTPSLFEIFLKYSAESIVKYLKDQMKS